ncbi:MAG: bifunctional phosphoribosylaminoimidazolecarboxamide formyltransferase/IMP cyclohydrolase [Cytophagaceae bacterium]
MGSKKIKSALISVFYKDKLDSLVKVLHQNGVTIYSTGGTQQFIEGLKIPVVPVEHLTSYPSILGGRVKTLHPKVFGGILCRRENGQDLQEIKQYDIPEIDLVIVDLYPFEQTVASGASEQEIIEKIDIGGVSLIRAAAKNFKDVVIIASKDQYTLLEKILTERQGHTELNDRRLFAARAFDVTSHYDTAIFNYFFSGEEIKHFKQSIRDFQVLRYGENPHQTAVFYGNMEEMFDKLNGKELSYNNLLDIDAAVGLIDEFNETAFAILKHNNACGVATAKTAKEAYLKALEADPVSAFGGVIITTTKVDLPVAEELNKLFFEVLIAPEYDDNALELLKGKKNRIILKRKPVKLPVKQFKTLLNGVIEQDKDLKTETPEELKPVTNRYPTDIEKKALLFANKIVKHTKSNTIVLAVDGQLISSGVGQTSRVDALRQAIEKAKSFGFSLENAVMASDAFFPFPDCVEIANKAGIKAVIQPGGSIKDQESIDYCNAHNMAMVCTGFRHFKH